MVEDIWFVYDGECPICQMGASLYKVRQSVGQLHTVNARTEKEHPVYLEATAAGLDLDRGMVVKYRNRLYQGEEALYIMATLGAESGWFNRMNNRLFRHRTLTKLCYPFMRGARDVALAIRGSGKIRNLDSHDH